MRSDSMSLFHVELLFQAVKRAVDKADLESLRSPIPPDEYDFESREIAENLCGVYGTGEEPATNGVDDLTHWLTAYWTRQFHTSVDAEWPATRNVRQLAQELIGLLRGVDTPAAHLQYLQWLRTSASGYAVTNEELLSLVRLWTARLVGLLYDQSVSGSNCTGAEADCQYAARRLRQIAGSAGYGETRRVMIRALLTWSAKVDGLAFIACLCNEVSRHTRTYRHPDEIDPETLQIRLQDCVSLFVECVLTQEELDMGCDWNGTDSTSGTHSIN
jgi:hypothetical protein